MDQIKGNSGVEPIPEMPVKNSQQPRDPEDKTLGLQIQRHEEVESREQKKIQAIDGYWVVLPLTMGNISHQSIKNPKIMPKRSHGRAEFQLAPSRLGTFAPQLACMDGSVDVVREGPATTLGFAPTRSFDPLGDADPNAATSGAGTGDRSKDLNNRKQAGPRTWAHAHAQTRIVY